MSQFAVIIFGDEAKANEATRVLTELQADNSLVLFSQAVIARDLTGTLALKDAASGGAVGSAVGALTGRLIAGPVDGHGDLSDVGALASFVQKAGGALKPGSTAIVAEISEDWVGPLDTHISALGGRVLRSSGGDSEADEIAKETARQVANIERLNAETEDANKPRETHREAVTSALDRSDACAKTEAVQADGNATTDALSGLAAAAARDARTNSSIAKANAEARSAKLSQGCGLTKDALG